MNKKDIEYIKDSFSGKYGLEGILGASALLTIGITIIAGVIIVIDIL